VDALILPLLFLWGQNDFVGWVFLGGFFIFLLEKELLIWVRFLAMNEWY
jgi:hypothetical protein